MGRGVVGGRINGGCIVKFAIVEYRSDLSGCVIGESSGGGNQNV